MPTDPTPSSETGETPLAAMRPDGHLSRQSHDGLRLHAYRLRGEWVLAHRDQGVHGIDGTVVVMPVSEHEATIDLALTGAVAAVKRKIEVHRDLMGGDVADDLLASLHAGEPDATDVGSEGEASNSLAGKLDAGEPEPQSKSDPTSSKGLDDAAPSPVGEREPERNGYLTDVIQGAIEVSSKRGSRPLARSIIRALRGAGFVVSPPVDREALIEYAAELIAERFGGWTHPNDVHDEGIPGGWKSDEVKRREVRWAGGLVDDLLAKPAGGEGLAPSLRLLADERARQCWSFEHDDEHQDGELARAAAAYAWPDDLPTRDGRRVPRSLLWPWPNGWKPGDRRRELVKAGALIVAELDRLDRLAAVSEGPDRPREGKRRPAMWGPETNGDDDA